MVRGFQRNWQLIENLKSRILRNNQTSSIIIVWSSLFVFFCLTLIAFTPSYINTFITDDFKHLGFVQPFLDKPYTIYKVFDPYFLGWYYRPTQLLFFSLFRFLFGANPIPYYIGLLLLHAVNIVLVYKVSRIWGNGRLGSIFAAGIFSVIATHQEVIGWISAVSILLAAVFSLLSFYSLRKYLNDSQQVKNLLVVILMAALAIFSREEAIVLFPLILVVWLFSCHRRPKQSEIWLFGGFGLFVITYSVIIFLRPTWTPHADAALKLNLTNAVSIQSSSRFLLTIFENYLSLENVQNETDWLTFSLILILMLVSGLAFWRGNSILRLGLLWTAALLLFLYGIVWLLSGNIAPRYLYLPWLGISITGGALIGQLRQKYPNSYILPSIVTLVLIGAFFYQTPLSRQRQQQWKSDAVVINQNETQIKELLPEINERTHIFAYNMPPITDYIQSMASVWYGVKLEGRGGQWDRLLNSGFATPNDYLFNYEEGLISNIMPELQEFEETVFIWQEKPVVEVINLDNSSASLDTGAYQLNQVIGPSGQKRFGFFIHPPAPETGWASLAYTTTVPYTSDLMFGIHKDWGQVEGEDGMTFRVNVVTDAGEKQTIFQSSVDILSEDWTELKLPMDAYWGQTVLLQFQVYANANLLHDHGYWANPRFVTSAVD
jgi:hypothetical protein